jgi:hypothetical protein
MIRRAATNSILCLGPMLRIHEYDRWNKQILRHAILTTPYEAIRIVRTGRDIRMRERAIKCILLRNNIPIELFESLKDYLYDYLYDSNLDYIERLPTKSFSRAVHHLIRCECVEPKYEKTALVIGKQFDDERKYRHFYDDASLFREMIWICIRIESFSTYTDICEYWC